MEIALPTGSKNRNCETNLCILSSVQGIPVVWPAKLPTFCQKKLQPRAFPGGWGEGGSGGENMEQTVNDLCPVLLFFSFPCFSLPSSAQISCSVSLIAEAFGFECASSAVGGLL